MNQQEITSIVKEIVSLRPANQHENETTMRNRLGNRISGELPPSSLRTLAMGSWQLLSKPVIKGDIAKCLLEDSCTLKTLSVAELRRQNNNWVLVYFEAQCPVCFGSGICDIEICELCFGIGWGAFTDADSQ